MGQQVLEARHNGCARYSGGDLFSYPNPYGPPCLRGISILAGGKTIGGVGSSQASMVHRNAETLPKVPIIFKIVQYLSRKDSAKVCFREFDLS